MFSLSGVIGSLKCQLCLCNTKTVFCLLHGRVMVYDGYTLWMTHTAQNRAIDHVMELPP